MADASRRATIFWAFAAIYIIWGSTYLGIQIAVRELPPLILAGGRGTRFWPKSRRTSAKQVLKLFGDRSLIQQTVDQVVGAVPKAQLKSKVDSLLK